MKDQDRWPHSLAILKTSDDDFTECSHFGEFGTLLEAMGEELLVRVLKLT
jgi:hypothetical protein